MPYKLCHKCRLKYVELKPNEVVVNPICSDCAKLEDLEA